MGRWRTRPPDRVELKREPGAEKLCRWEGSEQYVEMRVQIRIDLT